MPTLKQRIEKLESELAELRQIVMSERGKDWRRAVEKYRGDDDLQAVFAEALKLREAERRKVRSRHSPTRSRRLEK
jgi:hypothetical protein